jgi:uncharacterized coiled-coil protein SlyX
MVCSDQKCRLEIEQRLNQQITEVKDGMNENLKDERVSIYAYINERYDDIMEKMEDLRHEATTLCGKVVDTIYTRTRGFMTMTGFFTAFAIILTCVGILVGVFMTITTRANDRTNAAVDKRITEVEKSDHKQEETILEIEVTLGEIKVAIENLNKTTEELKDVIERQKGFPSSPPSTNTLTKEN